MTYSEDVQVTTVEDLRDYLSSFDDELPLYFEDRHGVRYALGIDEGITHAGRICLFFVQGDRVEVTP